jgi:hypothetical protein
VTANEPGERGSLVRIVFGLGGDSSHGSATETLWARAIGSDAYVLENSPFYAFGVSYQDIVQARAEGEGLTYVKTLRCGGHSTYRLLPAERWALEFQHRWELLAERGCTYEQGAQGLLSVDVPPGADIVAVYDLLQAGEDSHVWSFEEGHCGHPLG